VDGSQQENLHQLTIYAIRGSFLNNTSYAVIHFTLACACGSRVLAHFFVVRFRARSAKTNNDMKKKYRAAAGEITPNTRLRNSCQ